MLKATIIGHLGADAVCKSSNGREFIVFRIANTERWKDDAGQTHDQTTWVDCIMDGKPNVFPFLKRGQLVYASGSIALRVYSSEKERCMKAGMTINVRQVELLGGKNDDIPAVLYSDDGQKQFQVSKYFLAEAPADGKVRVLVSRNGERFLQNEDGWIYREQKAELEQTE